MSIYPPPTSDKPRQAQGQDVPAGSHPEENYQQQLASLLAEIKESDLGSINTIEVPSHPPK